MTRLPNRSRQRPALLTLGLSTLAVMLMLGACGGDGWTYRPPTAPLIPPPGSSSSPVVSETRAVSGFHGVELAGVGRVIITHGSESLTITAEEHAMPHLTAEVVGGTLILSTDGEDFSTAEAPIFEVTAGRIDELNLNGVGDLEVSGVDVTDFAARQSGVGEIRAAGRTDHQRVRTSGVGGYQAPNLHSRTANVRIVGLTNAVINASDRIEGFVDSNCTLEYYGNPTLDIRGGGTVTRIGLWAAE